MATINASNWKEGIEIAPYVSALPYVELDESSLRYTATTWQGYGTVYDGGIGYQTQFTYYGKFDYTSQSSILDSYITGANLATQSLGSFSIQGMRL